MSSGQTPSRRNEQLRARALNGWRAASLLVRERWELCAQADRESRPHRFAAYVAALDREAAAAAELARLSLPRAA